MDIKINKLPLAFMQKPYEDTKHLLNKILLTIIVISAISFIPSSFGYVIKLFLILITTFIVTKETEILYLTHSKNIYRKDAIPMLKTTNPTTTALILTLILPIGTPLYVVAVASLISIFIGKMVFGGFSYNPFNPALIGKLFVTISWPVLVSNSFNSGIVNYFLAKIFEFKDTLYTYSIFNYILPNNIIGDITPLILIIIFITMCVLKIIKPITTLCVTLTIILLTFIITKDMELSILAVITNSVLFTSIFLINDPITTPYSNYGKLVYGLIVGSVTTIILQLGNATTAIFYAVLFANLFVPMINSLHIKTRFGKNKQTYKLVIVTILCLAFISYLVISVGGAK